VAPEDGPRFGQWFLSRNQFIGSLDRPGRFDIRLSLNGITSVCRPGVPPTESDRRQSPDVTTSAASKNAGSAVKLKARRLASTNLIWWES
jgi:hypothetical protein